MKASRILWLSLFAVSIVTVLFPDSAAAEKVNLKPTLIVGSEYTILNKAEVSMALPEEVGEIPGGKGATTEQLIAFAVDPHEDGKSKVVKMRIDSIKFDLAMGGIQMRYDSSDPASKDAMIGAAFNNLVNKQIEMVYDENDEFVKMASTDAFEGGGAGGLPFGQAFGAEEMKELVHSSMSDGFPDGPIGIGDTWTQSKEVPLPGMGKMEFNLVYTYKADKVIDQFNCAIIEIKGEIKGDLKGDPGGDEASERRADEGFESSNVSGMVAIDKKLRFMVRSEMSMDMSLKLPGAPGAEAPVLPMRQKTVSEVINFRQLR